MTRKLSSEMSSQKIDLSADIRYGSLTLLGGFVILDLKASKGIKTLILAFVSKTGQLVTHYRHRIFSF